LSITIFESSSGGLFVPSEAGSRPGNYVTLPAQNIDSDGHITVPFAGKIRAAGKSIAAVQRDIEGQLAKRAIEPQVVINLSEQNATEVAVFGDATGGLKTKIAPGGERILDVIARAGVRYPGYEIFVTLQRADTRATVFFPNLVNRPYENIYVKPGDIIYVYRQPQTYIAVGAIGTVTQTQGLTGRFDFEAAHLSLAEAVAKAGGLLDTRANAAQVFLYRLEDREILERFGMDLDKFDPNMPLIPTIYRANYRDPSAFFVADGFPMRHKDIIYVANADSVEIEKFLGLVSTVSGTIAQVAVDTVTTLDPSGAN
jgi:polysaccharide export outer membrane protein